MDFNLKNTERNIYYPSPGSSPSGEKLKKRGEREGGMFGLEGILRKMSRKIEKHLKEKYMINARDI